MATSAPAAAFAASTGSLPSTYVTSASGAIARIALSGDDACHVTRAYDAAAPSVSGISTGAPPTERTWLDPPPASRRVSMLPPVMTSPTLRPLNRSGWEHTAASPVQPVPSHTVFRSEGRRVGTK